MNDGGVFPPGLRITALATRSTQTARSEDVHVAKAAGTTDVLQYFYSSTR